ncbi:uncharacterized protein BO66DRAFT_228033 [Aspergillus aculeatinus CBS 121060]|uniref:Uncharacterized protein n=1 Tax=Aspergillus aculeatinus CBS 121060 TaxID=1448322 RepID=A0ACD1GU49_9EURO|nr:hypothetical protein BO66DRAFT_228033 [Aspergillus aculeatinus CBS 121060]RAH64883.1 hypothetical protein BO66DRAFT_228033 [Aspergillus aculeatinus CBS 121060]
MSSENKQTQKLVIHVTLVALPMLTAINRTGNGVSNSLSAENLSRIPDGTSGGIVERFTQSPAADEPYFARARMHDRSEHASRLSSQLEATEKVLGK